MSLENFPPPTLEAQELLPFRAQLEMGKIEMSRELMMKIIHSLMTIHDGPFTCDEQWNMYEICKQWREDWLRRAKPDWVDIMIEIIIQPPAVLKASMASYNPLLAEAFAQFFRDLSRLFGDRALEGLQLLLDDKSTYPLVTDLLFKDY